MTLLINEDRALQRVSAGGSCHSTEIAAAIRYPSAYFGADDLRTMLVALTHRVSLLADRDDVDAAKRAALVDALDKMDQAADDLERAEGMPTDDSACADRAPMQAMEIDAQTRTMYGRVR